MSHENTGEDVALLARLAAELGLPLSARQQAQFGRYLELLLDWNARTNLTAIRDPEEIQVRHFLDALTCATVTGDLNDRSLVDIGTGAGLPGLPLKILHPRLRLTLADSVGKKVDFLRVVAAELGLEGVTFVNGRAEEMGQAAAHREAYDWAVARSVAELRVLAEYLLPLVRPGGHMLAMKGEAIDEEMRAALPSISQLGGGEPIAHRVRLPGTDRTHVLLVIDKQRATDRRYPRRVGVPAKRPL